MKPAALVLALAVVSADCATFSIKADQCPAYPATAPSPSPAPGAVKIQYLGSGGYLVRRGDDVVLFGPQYSNPGLPEVVFDQQIRTDRALVDSLLPKDADQAKAIVIGHAHYDHLLDTPYIANTHATTAKVYGSATMKNLISSVVDPARIIDVAPEAANHTPVKINDHVRLWPIKSQHSDQTRLEFWPLGIDLPVHMWRGEVSEPQPLPATASGWAEGEVYAYLLDFLDDAGKVEFRVYYQDSATDKPIGYPWGGGAPPDGKSIDVTLICVGGDFENIKDHPGGIIRATKPRFLVLGHWENFFEPQTDICRTDKVDAIPRFEMKEFMGEAKEAMSKAHLPGQPILACPTASVFHFPVDPAKDVDVYAALKKKRVSCDCGK